MSQVLSHQNIAGGTTIPSAETILATSAIVQAGGGGPAPALAKTIIRGVINMLAGTGTTAVVLKVYRGNAIVPANQVGASITVTLAAAANGSVPYSVEDTFALVSQVGGGQYSISLTQTGGSANGSVNQGDLSVEVAP